MIYMNNYNRRIPLQAGFCRIRSKTEGIILSVMVRLAGVTHSKRMESWIDGYTERRIAEMQKELIKLNWRKSQLEKK